MKQFFKSNGLQFWAALIVVFLTGFFSSEISAQSGCDCAPNEVVFELADANNLAAVAAQYKLKSVPLGQVGTPPTYRMEIDRTQTQNTPTQIVAAMQTDTRLKKPEVNRKLSSVERENLPWTLGRSWAIGRSWAVGGSQKGYYKQWFPDTIRLDQAHQVSKGDGVIIAVLDTGIDLSHPAFAGRLVPGYDFVDNDADPSEVGFLRQGSYGHGTHVAGIAALVAPNAKIMPIRILDSNGEGELWRITAAVIWAANHGATIINLSFGYPNQVNVLKDLVESGDDGITLDGKRFPEVGTNRFAAVIGAGNGGNAVPIFPAAEDLDATIGVGASTRKDCVANFSTYERHWVEVTAPGENIISALPGGRYGVWSGTSMSAPIVSGVAAIVKSRNSNLSPHDLLDRVKETSVDKRYNSGETRLKRIDALCAVTNNQGCPIPDDSPCN